MIIITFLDDSFQYDEISIPKCNNGLGDYCEGGILALDGITGSVIWQTWTAFNVFSLYCTEDLNGDSHVDCVAAGRGGVNILLSVSVHFASTHNLTDH